MKSLFDRVLGEWFNRDIISTYSFDDKVCKISKNEFIDFFQRHSLQKLQGLNDLDVRLVFEAFLDFDLKDYTVVVVINECHLPFFLTEDFIINFAMRLTNGNMIRSYAFPLSQEKIVTLLPKDYDEMYLNKINREGALVHSSIGMGQNSRAIIPEDWLDFYKDHMELFFKIVNASARVNREQTNKLQGMR